MGQGLSTAGLLDQAADEEAFSTAMDAFAMPSPEMRAAAEFAVVASFEPELEEAVAATIGTSVDAWLDPRAAGSPARAAKRGYLLALALGLLAVSHRPEIPDLDLAPQWHRLLAALGTERDPVRLPDEPRPPHLEFIRFDTGDVTAEHDHRGFKSRHSPRRFPLYI